VTEPLRVLIVEDCPSDAELMVLRLEDEGFDQPQVDLADGSLVGVEALVRLQHQERGLLPPEQFIPLAEELGIVGEIGEWVAPVSCRQVAAWQADGLVVPRVAVNLSAQQLEREDLAMTAGDTARFGGEEFALSITDVDEPALRAIAERFRVLVERSRVRAGQQDLRIAISIGGTVAGIGDTAEAIFERADAALYRAKEGGRNRVRLAGDAEASTG
jgi:predicted signal transduction protein with EAL and GGDEF domain